MNGILEDNAYSFINGLLVILVVAMLIGGAAFFGWVIGRESGAIAVYTGDITCSEVQSYKLESIWVCE